ncbi:sensor histidine kinase [Aureimonas sp. AU40]|uniref:sensor histidine kinase n=1 Tax=Aureimonas sp. AU40 TaxID=1637747 RepID=UPI0007833BA3|nr:HWE histidine kinase domain-containing protein [Aureimonas sp. AU40]
MSGETVLRAAGDVGFSFLEGGGECGELMRQTDWSATALGAMEAWPQSLRTVVGIMLGSRQPMLVVWGREQITLYNDGYAAMCGQRHPRALGRPFHDLWFDLWDVVKPILDRAYAGVSTHMDDIEFTMHRNGYPEETHFAFSYTPVRVENGEVGGMFCACTETTGEVIARRRMAAERARFQQMFQQAPSFMAMMNGPEHRFEWANPAYLRLVGDRDLIGRTIGEALPEAMEQGYGALLAEAFASGEAHAQSGARFVTQNEPGGPQVERFLDFVYQPVRDEANAVVGILVEGYDVTSRIMAEQQRIELMREMAHRMKNSMAMVQAIATQTLRQVKTVEEGREAISGRIAALARAQDILTRVDWDSADIREVVDAALSVLDHARGRFRISGGPVTLSSQKALGLSLALHELATNAVKYGALSNDTGQVEIEWDAKSDGDFTFRWQESGGPSVEVPVRSGFGTRLVQRIVAPYFQGVAKLDYATQGLVFTLNGKVSARL